MKRDGGKPKQTRRVAENKLYDQKVNNHNSLYRASPEYVTNEHSQLHSASPRKTLGHAAGEYEEIPREERRSVVPKNYEGSRGKSVFGTQPVSEYSQQSTFGMRPVEAPHEEPEPQSDEVYNDLNPTSYDEYNQNATYNKDEQIIMENDLRAMDEFKCSFFVRRI